MRAFQVLRFRAVASLREEVRALVTDHPSRCLDDPDAVELLVTQASVAASHRKLRFLSVWAPGRMHTVLGLLSRCDPDVNHKQPLNCHPQVGAYVARSLRAFDTAALTFVLPQLVQALRHDAGGQIGELLVDLCQRSALLSHQLMWILNSECKSSGEDGHGAPAPTASAGRATAPHPDGVDGRTAVASPPDLARHGFQGQLRGEDSLPGTVVALRDRILASFSGPSRRLFDVEYTFFDKITDISGILKRDVRDPVLRKAKIKEALRDIRIQADLDSDKQKWRDDDMVMKTKLAREGAHAAVEGASSTPVDTGGAFSQHNPLRSQSLPAPAGADIKAALPSASTLAASVVPGPSTGTSSTDKPVPQTPTDNHHAGMRRLRWSLPVCVMSLPCRLACWCVCVTWREGAG